MRHLFLADPSLWRVRWCFGAGSRPRSTATFPFEMYQLRINFALQKAIFDLVDVAFRAFQRGMWHGFVPDRISRYILKPLVARTGFLLRSRYISSTFVVRAWRSAPIEPREEGYADRTVPRVSRVPNEPCPDRTALGLPQSDRVPIEPRTKRAAWRSAPIEPRTDRGRGDSQGEPEPPLFSRRRPYRRRSPKAIPCPRVSENPFEPAWSAVCLVHIRLHLDEHRRAWYWDIIEGICTRRVLAKLIALRQIRSLI